MYVCGVWYVVVVGGCLPLTLSLVHSEEMEPEGDHQGSLSLEGLFMVTCSGSHGVSGHHHPTQPHTQRALLADIYPRPCFWFLPWVLVLWSGLLWYSSCRSFHGRCSWYWTSQSTDVSRVLPASSWLCPWENTPLQPSVTVSVLRLRGQKPVPQRGHVACCELAIDLSGGSP